MNYILIFIAFLALAVAVPGVYVYAGQADSITATELFSFYGSDKDFTVIDVRTPEEYEGGHIPGSVSLPLDTIVEVDSLPYTGTVILYCTRGVRSAKALEALSSKGIKGLKHLEGGIRSWISEGGNVVAGPYKDLSEYPESFVIPKGVCEVKDPAMEIGR